MGRELQKKKNRSSIPKVKQKPKSKRHLNPKGNPIIAANWNHKQTLSQNYQRLGLTSRLNSVTGGTEFKTSASHTNSKLAISAANPKVITPTEARVERDPETGKIVSVIHSSSKSSNPLNDLLASDDDDNGDAEGDADSVEGEGREIIKALENQASMIPEKRIRKQSQREKEWVERLVGHYGENYRAMSRDMKLNPMQQTEADIARRVRKWRDEGVVVSS